MSSLGLKTVTLKEIVPQLHNKELRGVLGAGVSCCHLGPPASESQGFLLGHAGFGPHSDRLTRHWAGTWGMHGDFDTQASQGMLLHHPPDLLGCRHQTGLASFAGGEMKVIPGAFWR